MTGENSPTRAMLAMRSLGDNSRHSELMSRYEHRFDRQHYRALEALGRLRQARRPPVSVARDPNKQREQNARAKRPYQPEESKESAQ
jgi:hypothetical protein